MIRYNSKADEPLHVVELFAGVGGFRLGLCGRTGRRKVFTLEWANQWEPMTASGRQHAAEVYRARFHRGNEPNPYFNEDIFKVPRAEIPDHDLLVGGFPCQDYSVARTLSHAAGIVGKKGVLWWAINDIVARKRPAYLMLENVDRLLKSPAKQRGRDFGIMLSCLSKLGYAIEWRVVNAADYGMPQRRRRTFILGYRKGSPLYQQLKGSGPENWLFRTGVIRRAFPILKPGTPELDWQDLDEDLAAMTSKFKCEFQNAGIMINGKFATSRVTPRFNGERQSLGQSIIMDEREVPAEYFIPDKELERWKYLKGAKRDKRVSKTGFEYSYNEGPVAFPDPLDRPSRTIITGEGGPSPARHKHVVLTKSGKLRRLTPIELERLCMFPDDHTKLEGISDQKRAFFMGNALVVGVIDRLGRSLIRAHRAGAPK